MLAEQQNQLYNGGRHAVRLGDVVFDCGANVGTFTRTALNAGAATVVAIEPAPDVVACLRKTFADELRSGRVIVVGKGVWDKRDYLTLRLSSDSVGDSFVEHPGARSDVAKIELTTVDQLLKDLNLSRVDYIKMDIEGAEQRALAGAAGTIARFHPRLAIATEHRREDPDVIPGIVRKLWPGYAMECGPCYTMYYYSAIEPDVMYFY
jgi:FkbM family methyltransferase